jgi:hypothetical protein
MSKEYATRFAKQLQSFVENTSPSTPSIWIGTIVNHSENLQYCDVRTKRGELRQIPTFGIPAIGTTAIILFVEDSYSQPVAVCNPINVLDDEKMKNWVGQFGKNYHNNGDFTKKREGYSGNFMIDDSVTTGEVEVSIEYDGFTMDLSESPKTVGNKYIFQLDILERKPYGAIPIQAIIKKKDGTPLKNVRVKYLLFGEACYAHTGDDGVAIYHCYPRQCFTEEGYFAVLPFKNSTMSFDCTLEKGEKDFFKIQLFFQSKDSVLGIKVQDKETGDIIQSVPTSLSSEMATWNVKSDIWLVNREVYPRDNHKEIRVTLSNEGDNPIRVDGILIHDECVNYEYYKSKEDLLNGNR